MTTTAVDIVIKTIGTSSIDQLSRKLSTIPTQASKASRGVEQVSKAVRGLGGALATLGAADQLRRAFGSAADYSGTQQRVQGLTQRYQQLSGIQDVARASAERFAVSNAQALSDLTDLGSRLGSTGVSLQEVRDIYEGFNTLLVNNAVNAQSAASAQLQLNQALGSGRLAGEEFNAINEATPQLLDEVADVLGVTRGELKKLASDGLITSKVLIQALTNIKTKGADQLNESLKTPAGELRKFNKAIGDFQVAVGTELLPVLTPFVAKLTELLKGFSDLPGPVKTFGVASAAAAVGVGALASALSLLNLNLGVLATGGLAGLATKLAAIGGGAKVVAVGFTAAGAAITKTTVAVTASTVAMGLLKAAMIALPWVAVAGATIVAIDAMIKFNQEQQRFNQLVASGNQAELEVEIKKVKAALEEATNKAKGYSSDLRGVGQQAGFAAVEVQNLKNKLAALEGRYKVVIEIEQLFSGKTDLSQIQSSGYGRGANGLTYTVAGVTYDARTGKPVAAPPKPFTAPTSSTGAGKGGGGGGGSAPKTDDTVGLQAQLQLLRDQAAVTEKINAAKLAGDQMLVMRLEGERERLQILHDGEEAIRRMNTEQGKSLQQQILDQKLTDQKVEQIQQLAELERQRQEALQGALRPIEDEIALLQAKINGNEEEIKQLIQKRDLAEQIARAQGRGAPNAEDRSAADRLVTERDELQKQGDAADKLKQQYEGLADTIAGSLTGAFKDVITGAKSTEQALSDAFKNIADAFLDMAMKMIQEWLKMQIMGIFTKGLGGGGGGGGGAPFGFADGGYVTGPTPALIGEGGEPEYVIPASKMDSAMARYSAGTRGEALLNGGSGTDSTGAQSTPDNTAMQITINGGVTRIGDTDYIRRDELPSIVGQASKMGEARTMRRLQMSPGARRKVGL